MDLFPEPDLQDSEQRQRRRPPFRFLWYVFATVLILSLPTFSYLVPDPSLFLESIEPVETQPDEPPARKTTRRYSAPLRALQSGFSLQRRVQPASPSRTRPGIPSRRTVPNSSARRATSVAASVPRKDPEAAADTENRQLGAGELVSQTGIASAVPYDERLYSGFGDNVDNALAELEQGYRQVASAYGYRGLTRGSSNPFQDTLDNTSGEAGDSTSPDSSTDGSTPGDPGDATDSGGGGEPPDLDVVDSPPEEKFDFLIVGRIAGNPSTSLVSRAKLDEDGSFVLDNFFRFSFYPGAVHALIVVEEDSTILTCDLNGDGLTDFVTTRLLPTIGTSINAYVRTARGFELFASTFLYYQAARSLALFDFDRDDRKELAVLIEGQRNLLIYRSKGTSWDYMKELVLPMDAGLLFTSRLVSDADPALFIIGRNLQQSVTITREQPNLLQFGLDLPLTRMRTLEVSWKAQEPGTSVRVFELGDRIVLLEDGDGFLNPFVSLDIDREVPFMIVGDYAQSNSRQVVWVP